MKRVLGVLAGADAPLEQLAEWAREAEVILAADGGADRLMAVGIRPSLTVGDFDSLRSTDPGDRLYMPEQDRTDCDKLLATAKERGFEELTMIGCEGDLPDHEIATLHSIAESGLSVRIVYRTGLGYVIGPGEAQEFESTPGHRVSLLPLTPTSGVDLVGVEWPLQGASLQTPGLRSISNRANGDRVGVRIGSGYGFFFVGTNGPPEVTW